MSSQEWARCTISFFDSSGEITESVEMPGLTLAEQLVEAETWLGGHADAISRDPVSTRLFCSWSPKEGQHATTFDAGLIRAMAEVDATFWLDVYPPE